MCIRVKTRSPKHTKREPWTSYWGWKERLRANNHREVKQDSSGISSLGLVHTGDRIGIRSVRNLSFQCESKNGDGIVIARIRTFPFSSDSIACDQEWTGWSESEGQAEESTNHIAHSQSLFTRLERKTWRPSAILNEGEASVSASIVLIHTRSRILLIDPSPKWRQQIWMS